MQDQELKEKKIKLEDMKLGNRSIIYANEQEKQKLEDDRAEISKNEKDLKKLEKYEKELRS